MRITNISIQNNTHFLAKKKNLRLSDDIVRKTKHEFPALSPSYIDDYWLCTRNPKHSSAKRNIEILTNTLNRRLHTCRTYCNFLEDVMNNPFGLLEATKKFKLANCIEFAQLVQACLLANGYKDSKIEGVLIKVRLYDKATKNKVYEYTKPFDHAVVLSALDDNKNPNNQIILDAWIGKAMSLSEAKAQYLKMLSKKDIEEMIADGIENCMLSSGRYCNYSDFDYSIKIVFDEFPDSFLKNKFDKNPTKITKMLRRQFPNLILHKTQG